VLVAVIADRCQCFMLLLSQLIVSIDDGCYSPVLMAAAVTANR
jgi:hypothetical protein